MSKLLVPVRQFLRACRRSKNEIKFADSMGVSLTGGRTLLSTLVLRRLLHRTLGKDELNVGLLMPTSVYGVIANLGLAMDRRVSVNLNYTFNQNTINDCINKSEIKHVITSRKMLERFPTLKLDAELIFMEDIPKKVTLIDKLTGWVDAYVTPICALEVALGLTRIDSDDLITIIFTSGSTGTPKGAMITQNAIAENVRAFVERINLTGRESILGALPLFHAYGYSTTFWLPALTELMGVYHFNPLDYKRVGEMAKKYNCVLFPTTPTFLRGYLRRCGNDDFASTNTVVGGAEKMPMELADQWEQKYGHRPVEGYGTTELSPVVSVNVPKSRRDDYKNWSREGTIGRPFFNLQARITDPQSGELLPNDVQGMLQIKGPTVMKGYYKDPQKTDEVIKDGWYSTGDIASIDADGFITITGRLSRISKIAGEMVPHALIEEEIDKIINTTQNHTDEDKPEVVVAVSAVADVEKGERIIVLLQSKVEITPQEICKKLQNAGLPSIWIPTPTNFYKIDTIPTLGTGKLDLREVKKCAEKYSQQNNTKNET
ncbi:MAG: AMP-binding protein [Planctomycetaceae bacterium]|jgi:acyl-[acyl-carrier-protein]-phospholipid O-acyltransferase/long-chain-fatty-acid--[acyl-carrier-protein] ligase|nr:AMP-binding protein [Planctomycetaceae bacterium]